MTLHRLAVWLALPIAALLVLAAVVALHASPSGAAGVPAHPTPHPFTHPPRIAQHGRIR